MKRKLVTKLGEEPDLDHASREGANVIKVTRSGKVLTGVGNVSASAVSTVSPSSTSLPSVTKNFSAQHPHLPLRFTSTSAASSAINYKLPLMKTRVVFSSSTSSALPSSTSVPSSSVSRRVIAALPDLKLKVERAGDARRVVVAGRQEGRGGKQTDTDTERERRKLLVERVGQEKKVSDVRNYNSNGSKKGGIVKRRRVVERVGEEHKKEEESEREEASERESGEEEREKPRIIQRDGRVLAITIRNAESKPEEEEEQREEEQREEEEEEEEQREEEREEAEEQEEEEQDEQVEQAEEEQEEEESFLEEEEEESEEQEEEPTKTRPPLRGHKRTAVLSSRQLSDSEDKSASDSDSSVIAKGVSISKNGVPQSRSRSSSPPSRTIKVAASHADATDKSRTKSLNTSSNSKDNFTRSKKAEQPLGRSSKDSMSRSSRNATKSNEQLQEEKDLQAIVLAHERSLAKFMRTKSRPHIFFAPATLCARSRAWQAKCEKEALEKIDSLESE